MSTGPTALTPPRWLFRGGAFLPILGTLWALWSLTFVFVWIVDPYQLRSAGAAAAILARHPYPIDVLPRLVSVAARDGADLVIVGASTARGYTPAMLRDAFPEAERPFNLSYPCADMDDFRLILQELERSKALRRVIVSLEYTLIKKCPGSGSPLDPKYYLRAWKYLAPDYGLETVELSARALLTGVLDMPAWRSPFPDRVVFPAPMTNKPEAMAAIRSAVETSRPWITQAPEVSCDAIPFLSDVLAPFVRRMSERGVKVDILAPPYSLGMYAQWSVYRKDVFPGDGAVFANLMALRRCALAMTSGIPGVRFHAFDTDLAITGNLSNYFNPVHITNSEVYRDLLKRIAGGNDVLTAGQWPSYQTTLAKDIQEFRP